MPAAHQDAHLLFDGARLDPERNHDGTWVFAVPDAAASIRLCSASGVLAEIDITNDDERVVGVGVGSLVFEGQPISLEDARLGAGWYSMETQDDTARRWTDGDATLDGPGPGRLTVGAVRVMQVWATAATSEPLPPGLDRPAPTPPPDMTFISVEAAFPRPTDNLGKLPAERPQGTGADGCAHAEPTASMVRRLRSRSGKSACPYWAAKVPA